MATNFLLPIIIAALGALIVTVSYEFLRENFPSILQDVGNRLLSRLPKKLKNLLLGLFQKWMHQSDLQQRVLVICGVFGFLLIGAGLGLQAQSAYRPSPSLPLPIQDIRVVTVEAPRPVPTATTNNKLPDSCAFTAPNYLTPKQLSKLGCPRQDIQTCIAVAQKFEKGVMVIYPRNCKEWAHKPGGSYVFAMSDTKKAWRTAPREKDAHVLETNNRLDWYLCSRPSTDISPGYSGVPWRGFGSVWCDKEEIRTELGGSTTDELNEGNLSTTSSDRALRMVFQDFDNGVTIHLLNLKIDNWFGQKTYVLIWSSDDGGFKRGDWE